MANVYVATDWKMKSWQLEHHCIARTLETASTETILVSSVLFPKIFMVSLLVTAIDQQV